MKLSPLLVPASSDTHVQFNDGQLFAGKSTFTFTKGTDTLTIGLAKITGGSPGAGKVLTSDGDGLASWAAAAAGGDFSDGGDSTTGDRTLGNVGNHDLGLLTNNTNRFHIQNDGLIGVGTTSQSALFDIVGSTDIVQLSVKAHSTQTANIAETYNSSGTLTGGIDDRGLVRSHGDGPTSNTFIGVNSGQDGCTTTDSVGIGNNSLTTLTGGGNHVAIGAWALRYCTSAYNNVAIGNSAGANLTIGSSNVCLGNAALTNCVNGGSNMAIGNTSLYNILTDNAIGIGVNAGRYYGAGTDALTSAPTSIFIGATSKAAANSESNQIVIGYLAIGNGSNTMTLGNSSIVSNHLTGTLGVNAATISAQCHVDQDSASAAIPVLYLNQTDISEEMIEFNTTIGTGNAIEAIASKTLTTTHFIKVTLPGSLTRYIPCGTIAS